MKIVTDQQITDAAMELILEKGYSETTTVEIAQRAGVNETTLFRRLGSKKEIVLKALQGNRWVPYLDTAIFENPEWDLEIDLARFMKAYYKRVTTDNVILSIRLRSPKLFEETASYIMKVPNSFMDALTGYFAAMQQMGKIPVGDPYSFAMTVFSATLGFVFLQASFGTELSTISQEEYIDTSVKMFANGLNSLTSPDS